MKVYISIPITGQPIEEAKEYAEWLKSSLEVHGHKCITPFSVDRLNGREAGEYFFDFKSGEKMRIIHDYSEV